MLRLTVSMFMVYYIFILWCIYFSSIHNETQKINGLKSSDYSLKSLFYMYSISIKWVYFTIVYYTLLNG